MHGGRTGDFHLLSVGSRGMQPFSNPTARSQTSRHWSRNLAVFIIFWGCVTAAGATTAPSNSRVPPGNAFADGCTPPSLASWPAGPPKVPPLPPGQKPNFIVILADDMGYDDIGLHHPRAPDGVSSAGAQTPNLDRLIKSSMSFTNFYSSPLCAMGRAQLLTGRDYPRTGNLFNSYGYDAFSLTEATMGDVLQQVGYVTAHYGKWHNGRTLGYEPWERGFNESWLPSEFVHLDNLMRYNGQYIQTKGLMEQFLVDRMVKFMKEREKDRRPFLIYYAPHAIHTLPRSVRNATANAPRDLYFSPEPYYSMVKQAVKDLPQQPLELIVRLWAFLLYFDDVLGQLLDAVNSSVWLRSTTYIMVSSDNGVDMPGGLPLNQRLLRMPSGMLGDKNYVCDTDAKIFGSQCVDTGAGGEGALRTHLVVSGPGVPSGAVDDTLLGLADILPTMADLADANKTRHQVWSGMTFANLLAGRNASQAQLDRAIFTLAVSPGSQQCSQAIDVMTRWLPDLGPDRRVLKPQPMLAYVNETGASVMKSCIVARYKEFKWYGRNNRVFRMANGSHIELDCNEVTGILAAKIADMFDKAARLWWDQVLAEPNSFNKLDYQIGLRGERVTNAEADGVIQFSRGSASVTFTANVELPKQGDFSCSKVRIHTSSWYNVVAQYHATFPGLRPTFRVTVGDFQDIQAGTATSVMANLTRDGAWSQLMGRLLLKKTAPGGRTEVCTQLLSITNITSGRRIERPHQQSWKFLLANIRFILDNNTSNTSSIGSSSVPYSASYAAPEDNEVPSGMPAALMRYSMEEPAVYEYVQPTPAMQEMERHIRAAEVAAAVARRAAAPAARRGSTPWRQAWWDLQQRYKWADGQVVFDSLYRQCISEVPVCRESCG